MTRRVGSGCGCLGRWVLGAWVRRGLGAGFRWTFKCHSKVRKHRKKKGAEIEEQDEEARRNDTPVLFVRVDPELRWLRRVTLRQREFMWNYQVCAGQMLSFGVMFGDHVG